MNDADEWSGAGGGGPGRSGPGRSGPGRSAGGASDLEPGQWVRHPDRPDWGDGQVQSVIGERVTVNFENAGKILVNGQVIRLVRFD
jgi:hypothetical protein